MCCDVLASLSHSVHDPRRVMRGQLRQQAARSCLGDQTCHLARAPPFRLFSCTPISAHPGPIEGRNLSFDAAYKPKWKPKLPASTAYQYFETSDSDRKNGQSSGRFTPSVDPATGLERSFIFDLDTVPGDETLRDTRLKIFREQLEERKSLARELKEATWFSDPYWRMMKSPPRKCFVTSAVLPTDFLIQFKPVLAPGDSTASQTTAGDVEETEVDDVDFEAEDHQSSDQDMSPQSTHSVTSTRPRKGFTLQPSHGTQDDSENVSNAVSLPRKKYNPARTILLPHRILHPRFAPSRGGSSLYATSRREIVAHLPLEGRHKSHLSKLARNLTVPPNLTEIIDSQLQDRIVQELRLLFDRIRTSSDRPNGQLRDPVPETLTSGLDFQSYQKSSADHVSQEEHPADGTTAAGIPLDIPPYAKVNDLDPRWMLKLNGSRNVLHRLSLEDERMVMNGHGYMAPDTIAIIDIGNVDFEPAQPADTQVEVGITEPLEEVEERRSAQSAKRRRPLQNEDFHAQGPRLYPLTTEGHLGTAPVLTMISGPKGDIPIFHLRNILPAEHLTSARDLIDAILAFEVVIKARTESRVMDGSSLKSHSSASPDGIDNATAEELTDIDQQSSKPTSHEPKSVLLALNSWIAPRGLVGRRGDLGIALFIALQRIRLWNGGGWKTRYRNRLDQDV
ncbi:hypothetical protein BD324DRAFT_620153 [Kockovaella imperatae]|uniref:Uncharacterized protein n=1 Tax=Kockovaella imperatae TaxID=4999 RepID=A0A1Y1UJM6_9TREE|nr:hypothetical protein BD324DRAFT_620153 [Kockovaella imperatae]ORX38253.1 hypothetical protein BD324DRAFT_620153 [Kockovaella imperatae]